MKTEPIESTAVRHDHFVIDENRRLRQIDADLIESILDGNEQIPDIDNGEFCFVSIIRTEDFVGCYYFAVGILGGYVAADCLSLLVQDHYMSGLRAMHGLEDARDWGFRAYRRQIANSHGVAEESVHDLGIGGPAVVARLLQVSLSDAVEILADHQREHADDLAKARR